LRGTTSTVRPCCCMDPTTLTKKLQRRRGTEQRPRLPPLVPVRAMPAPVESDLAIGRGRTMAMVTHQPRATKCGARHFRNAGAPGGFQQTKGIPVGELYQAHPYRDPLFLCAIPSLLLNQNAAQDRGESEHNKRHTPRGGSALCVQAHSLPHFYFSVTLPEG